MLILQAMGCGRSKHHSPKLGDEERDVHTNKEKGNGKKKKGKGEKKENKAPGSTNTTKSANLKLSPVKSILNSLKPPPPQSTNDSPTRHSGLHLDIPDQTKSKPVTDSKPMDQLAVPGKNDAKAFAGRSNIKVTSSQIAFFKMLDEKIEQGDDYASEHSIDLSEDLYEADDS